jgi:hypothetical protein
MALGALGRTSQPNKNCQTLGDDGLRPALTAGGRPRLDTCLGRQRRSVPAEYTYEPFGTTVAAGSLGDNTLGFTARETDGTGLYYYRADTPGA